MSSSSATPHAAGFEAYIATLAKRTPAILPRQLHPDFDTWEACFAHINATGPLEVALPTSTKTNLELMRLLDVLRRQDLDLVNTGDRPGHVAICTRAQATALRAQRTTRMGQVRHYLTKPS